MNVEKCKNKLYRITDIINGVLVTESYFYYTKEEAISRFKKKHKQKEPLMAASIFKGLSIAADSLHEDTLKLLLDQYADWIPTDNDGLLFKKETLEQFLQDDFFDENDKPSQETLDEIKRIVQNLSGSSILYLSNKE